MGFMETMKIMNYAHESGTSCLYKAYSNLISENQDIFTEEKLKTAQTNLLPPNAFDDGKIRSNDEYMILNKKIKDLINAKGYEQGRSM